MADIWITEDKREIPVEKMTDSHVVNALRCFRAKAVAHALDEPPTDNDTEIAQIKQDVYERLYPVHRREIAARVSMMEREAARRGLDV